MMKREAAWLGDLLARIDVGELDPILSVGSGTRHFRQTFQPWIEQRVYAPLERRSVRVLHHELEPADGVDVSGDLGDEDVRRTLRELGVRAILCLNVFEHVLDRSGLAAALVASLPPAGLLVVTVPHRFPYHADPIDTMFRPSPHELHDLFAGADVEVVEAGTVRCESLLSHWLSKPGKLGAVRKAFAAVGRRRGHTHDSGGSSPGVRTPPRELLRMAFVSTAQSYVLVKSPPVPA